MSNGTAFAVRLPPRNSELFCHLLNAQQYLPGLWNLSRDDRMRRYWCRVFASNMADIRRRVEARGPQAARRALAAEEELGSCLERYAEGEGAERFPTVLHMTYLRDGVIDKHGLGDTYMEEKEKETEWAVERYAGVVDSIWSRDSFEERLRECFVCFFAGNLFDLGCHLTSMEYRRQGIDFEEKKRQLRESEWMIDHAAPLAKRLEAGGKGPHHSLVIAIDNAGPDFVHGSLPLARLLAAEGWRVVLAANEKPSLNDVTADEAKPVIDRLSGGDPQLASSWSSGQLSLVSSGSVSPGFDLRFVGPEFNRACERTEVLFLTGQGRAVETCWNARLGVDCVRVSSLKDRVIARAVGGRTFDVLLRFTAAMTTDGGAPGVG